MRRATLILALCALPKLAHAGYCLKDPESNHTFIHWPQGQVRFTINSSTLTNVGGQTARQAIVDAFQVWAGATCTSIQITDGGDSTSTAFIIGGADHVGEINVFFANDDTVWGQQGSNTTYIAATYYNHTEPMGQPALYVNATIMFNAAHFQYSATPTNTQMDIEEVALLEIGQLLGIQKNPTNQSSVMYGSIAYGDTQHRVLTQDDQDAISYLYPKTNPQGACAQVPPPLAASMCPDNTGSTTGGTGGGGTGGNPGGTGGVGGSGGAGGASGGAGGSTGGSADSGCGCHVGARGATGAGVTVLALLATLALCATRRRSR